jgi:hypothetical protein
MVIINSVITMRNSIRIMSVTNLLNNFGDKKDSDLQMRKEMEFMGF